MDARLIAFAGAAWLYLAGIVVQVFLAGIGLFEVGGWELHANLGWLLGSAPILLLVLALVARVDRRTAWWTLGLALAAVVQPELAAVRDEAPVVAAFHPLNALVVFGLAWVVAYRSARALRISRVDWPRV